MSMSAKLRHAPLRLATGAYILNSGIGKLSADEEMAKGLHGAASGAYPQLQSLEPTKFARTLAIAETALGGALLLPIVPARVAGAGLVGFSGALLGMYWRTPGMHEPGSPRPTQQGIAIAKDSWMLGIGASLMLDSGKPSARAEHRAERKAEARAAKAARKAELRERRSELVHQALEGGAELGAQLSEQGARGKAEARARAKAARAAAKQRTKSARKAAEPYAKAARKAAQSAAATAGDSARSALSTARDTAGSVADTARDAARDVAATAHG